MSTWKPSEGLLLAEMLAAKFAAEAAAAGSKITPLFQHRMVEVMAKTFDGAMAGHDAIERAFDDLEAQGLVERVPNGHDDEAVHAKDVQEFHDYMDAKPKRTAEERASLEEMGVDLKAKKAAKGKPAKAGAKKRGRPSKAEIEARKAQA